MFDFQDTIGIGTIILAIPTSALAYLTFDQRRKQIAADTKAETARILAAKEAKASTVRQQEIQTAVQKALDDLHNAASTQVVAAEAQSSAATSLGQIHKLVNSNLDEVKARVEQQDVIIAELKRRLDLTI